ncbi:MAG: imidazole glycerol phosphate synthase subunit HisH [Promethearchaeia archaeon]
MGFYIAIIDYEMGNLKSIYKCLEHISANAKITDKKFEILNADGVILPGVGAFGDAMKSLRQKELIVVISQLVQEEIPLLGICLGLQLLFTKSYEMGKYEGLNIIKGEVIPFDLKKVDKVPQIGWNCVDFQKSEHFLIDGIPNNSYFYFVHSYHGVPEKEETILGRTEYGELTFCSMISKGNVFATQFHPEKSSKYGILMYENFVNYCKK